MSSAPDVTINASLTLGNSAIAVLQSQPYHRTITNIFVLNTAAGGVKIYRGSLGSNPITGNPIGNNQNVEGRIPLPPGQQLFVVWDLTPVPLSGASARISSTRDDSPLDGSTVIDDSLSVAWDINAISTLTVPTGATSGARIVIGTDPTGQFPEFTEWNGSNNEITTINIDGITQFNSAADGSFARLVNSELVLNPPNVVGSVVDPGVLLAASNVGKPGLFITSPDYNSGAKSSLVMTGTDGLVAGKTSVAMAADDFQINNRSLGLGLVLPSNIAVVDSGAAGVAELVTMNFINASLLDKRAYEIRLWQTLVGTAASVTVVRIRRNNVLGALRGEWYIETDGNFQSSYVSFLVINNSGATIVDNIEQTLSVAAGTVKQTASVNRITRMDVVDVGAAADYPGALQW